MTFSFRSEFSTRDPRLRIVVQNVLHCAALDLSRDASPVWSTFCESNGRKTGNLSASSSVVFLSNRNILIIHKIPFQLLLSIWRVDIIILLSRNGQFGVVVVVGQRPNKLHTLQVSHAERPSSSSSSVIHRDVSRSICHTWFCFGRIRSLWWNEGHRTNLTACFANMQSTNLYLNEGVPKNGPNHVK